MSQMQRVDDAFRATLNELRSAILGPLEPGEPSVTLTGPTPNVSSGVELNSTMTVVLRRMAARDVILRNQLLLGGSESVL